MSSTSTKTLKLTLKTLIGAFLLAFAISSVNSQPTTALSGSDFQAGRIMDDVIFFTGTTMTTNEIQAFLDAKLPTCDTNGSQLIFDSTHNDTVSRATYSSRRGVSTPFTCLKDYRMDVPARSAESGLCNGYNAASNQTAAQIIHNVGLTCGVNPKALLVLLQKEQSLVTDDWPWPIQYRSATGYGCPDTAPCDEQYYGFFNQVYSAARQFKRYAVDSHLFSYKAGLTNFVQYHPNAACGGTNIAIQNQTTAGLYNYTPYQPNAAALNNLYGTGDGCSAYGNRNFWRMYNDWFGPTINDAYLWEIVHETSSGKLYLVVNNKIHWIPNPTILAAWGLDDDAYRDVDSTYVNQLTSGPNLESVALDLDGTRYLMSQGKRYKLKSDGYVLIWGVAGMEHISAPGLLTQTPSGGNAGRFAKLPDDTTYLLNNYEKHLPIDSESFDHWGITEHNVTDVLASDISHLSNGSAVDRFTNYYDDYRIVDSGKWLKFKNGSIEHGWSGSPYVHIFPFASNALSRKTLGDFVSPGNDKVYFVENGNYHHAPTKAHSVVWGLSESNPLTTISSDLFSTLNSGSSLGYVVNNSTNGEPYLLAKTKHRLDNANLVGLYAGSGASIPTFSGQSLSAIPTGPTIKSPIVAFSGDSKVYVLDNANLRHLSSRAALHGFGSKRNNPILSLPNSNKQLFGSDSAVGSKVRNGSNSYYAENGYRYTIDNDYKKTWKAQSSPTISDELLAELTGSGQTLTSAVKIGDKRYLMNNGVLNDVSSNYETFGLSTSDFGFIFERNFPSTGISGYFVQSMTGSKVYLLSYGKIYHISNPQVLSDLGFGEYSGLVSLHPDIMTSLLQTQSTKASRLVKAPGTGVLFASNGKGYAMPNSTTLNDYKGSKNFMTIAPEFFNQFAISGSASRVTAGTDGKVYAIDNNQKRWVTNATALSNNYSGEPILNLPQATLDGFTTGSNINN